MIYELLKLNCEIENGDNKCNRYEDFVSLKNKINLIIKQLNRQEKKNKPLVIKAILKRLEQEEFIEFKMPIGDMEDFLIKEMLK